MVTAERIADPGSALDHDALAGRRILFLGSAYHPLSVASLAGLIDRGADVIVAAEDPATGSARRTIAGVWRRRGGRAVARRIKAVASARARLAARSAGIALRGAASVPELSSAHHLESVSYEDPNDAALAEFVRSRQIELIVMANYRRILRRRLFASPRFGTLNVHPSMLPAFRGPDPIYWIIARGARVGGVTIHQVDEGVDTGPLVIQESFSVNLRDDEGVLLRKSSELARRLVPQAVARTLSGFSPVPQRTDQATYFPSAPRGASSL